MKVTVENLVGKQTDSKLGLFVRLWRIFLMENKHNLPFFKRMLRLSAQYAQL